MNLFLQRRADMPNRGRSHRSGWLLRCVLVGALCACAAPKKPVEAPPPTLKSLAGRVRPAGANAGVHVVVWLPGVAASSLESLIARAHRRGVGIYSIAPHFLRPPREAGLLLGYAALDESAIREGIGRLAQVLDEGP